MSFNESLGTPNNSFNQNDNEEEVEPALQEEVEPDLQEEEPALQEEVEPALQEEADNRRVPPLRINRRVTPLRIMRRAPGSYYI